MVGWERCYGLSKGIAFVLVRLFFFCLCEEPVALGAVGEIEVGDERLEFGEAGAGDGCGWFLIEVCFNVCGCGGGVGDNFVA